MNRRHCQPRWLRSRLLCRPNWVKIQTQACLQPRVPRLEKGGIPARRPTEAGYGGGGGAMSLIVLHVVVMVAVRALHARWGDDSIMKIFGGQERIRTAQGERKFEITHECVQGAWP